MNIHIQSVQPGTTIELGDEIVFTVKEFRVIMLDWSSQKNKVWDLDLLERSMKLMWHTPGLLNRTLLEDFVNKALLKPVVPKEVICRVQSQFARTLGNEALPDFQCLLAGSKKCSHLMTKEGASSQGDALKSEFCNRIWITE